MKTLDQVINNFKCATFDGRDIARLAEFLPLSAFEKFGLTVKDDHVHTPKELTRENIMINLKSDLEFAFEKALDKRGLSSMCMYQVIKMWNWILEDGLENWSGDNYAQYGLPLYKATALQYKLDNPIGDDAGDESHYEG